MKKILTYICTWYCLIGLWGCKKEFLDVSPNIALTIPTKLSDFEALLEDSKLIPSNILWMDLSADEYYLQFSNWQALNLQRRNAYIWKADILEGATDLSWNSSYEQIYITNVVLEGLDKIKPDVKDQNKFDQVYGRALFSRGRYFYNLSQVYAPVYQKSISQSELGIVLRLNADLPEKSKRASVEQTYNQMLNDMQHAARLLPEQVDLVLKNRPSKPAAFAMMARVYLAMQNYEMAGKYADSCLLKYSYLLPYETLSTSMTRPFPLANPELLMDMFVPISIFHSTTTMADTLLYNSYLDDDLRKVLFFKTNTSGKKYFAGQYSGGVELNNGPGVDEMYLIRAESHARANRLTEAASDLNTLLKKRYKPGKYADVVFSNAAQALNVVLSERKKELVLRGLRWTDLRRLNLETDQRKTLKRLLDGKEYVLEPNDKKYVFQIPANEIEQSGIEQNSRP